MYHLQSRNSSRKLHFQRVTIRIRSSTTLTPHSLKFHSYNRIPTQQTFAEVGGALPAIKIKVVALPGSLRRNSTTEFPLIDVATEIVKESIDGLEIECVDISPLPMLNTDLEIDGTYPPPVVDTFHRKILEADSVLFASPEYNYSVTAPLKNAIDWASRPPNVWGDKAAAIVSASGGSGGVRSHYHLRQIGIFLDLHFINKPEFFLNAYQPPPKFDANGDLIDDEVRERLKALLLALHAFALRL